MKKNYLLSAAIIASFLIPLNGNPLKAQNLNIEERVQQDLTNLTLNRAMSQTQAQEMFPPQPRTIVKYKKADNSWLRTFSYQNDYDKQNRCISQIRCKYDSLGVDIVYKYKYLLQYNEYGQCKEEIGFSTVGKKWSPQFKHLYGYDNKVMDFRILTESYTPIFKSSEPQDATEEGLVKWEYHPDNNSNFYTEILRDSLNRVTDYTYYTNKEKQRAFYNYSFVYGENNQATDIILNSSDSPNILEPTYYYENIQWHKTNCQYVDITGNIYYPFYNSTENLASYYRVGYFDGIDKKIPIAEYTVKYDEQDRIVEDVIETTDSSQYIKRTIVYLDDKGSSTTMILQKMDNNRNGKIESEEISLNKYTNLFNEHKHCILAEEYVLDPETGKEFLKISQRNKYNYDEQGNLLKYIYSEFDIDQGKYAEKQMTEYSDYTNAATGIDTVKSQKPEIALVGNQLVFRNATGLNFSIYDGTGRICKQGVVSGSYIEMGKMSKGVYIVHIGNESVKVLKK